MATVSKAFLEEMDAMEVPEPPETGRWDPEKNPMIAGRITGIEPVETNNGSGTKVTLVDEGPHRLGPVSFFASTVIKNQFDRQRIGVGAVVGIKYFGEVAGKNGYSYKNYGVKVQQHSGAQKPLPTAAADVDPFEDE